MNFKERAERERIRYDEQGGLQRKKYTKILLHSKAYSHELMNENTKKKLLYGNGNRALEIGCNYWRVWLEEFNIYPHEIHCINISNSELENGKKDLDTSKNKPFFHLMDAHELDFEDHYFDIIYGGHILHHLDLDVALQEMQRVLKPDGQILFEEPLDINPVGKIVRYFTPQARTVDEQAFRFKELSLLKRYFSISLETYQLFSVPIGVLSGLTFERDKNPLTYSAYMLDTALQSLFPPLKYLYRRTTISGKQKK